MLKGSDLIGLPEIASDSGQTLANTQDIIISQEHDRLMGLLIRKGGWAGRAQVVAWSEVLSADLNAIVVRSHHSIVDANDMPELQRILEDERGLRGLRMCTTDGVDLGVIMDLFFSRKTGVTEGYEVCGRLLDEATSHCAFVSASFHPRVEKQTAWVPPAVADVVRRQIENVRHIQLPGVEMRQGQRRTAQDLRDSALVSMAEMARGQQLLWDIRSPEGWLVAVRGQLITDAVIQRAIAHDRLRELLRAVDMSWIDRQDTS